MSKKCRCCNGTGRDVDNAVLGRTLSGLRLRAGISLRTMSFFMGYSHSYLSQLEAGKRKWTPEMEEAYRYEIGRINGIQDVRK